MTTSMQLYWRLLHYVKPHIKVFVVAILTTAAMSVTEPMFPALMKPLLDEGFSASADPDLLWKLPLGIVAIFVVRGIFGFISSYAFAWVANRVIQDLRDAMYRRLVHLPDTTLRSRPSSSFITKVTYDVAGVADAAVGALTTMIKDSMAIIGLVAWLMYLNWRLTLICVVVLPAMSVIVRQFSKRLRALGRASLDSNSRMTQILQETVLNQRVVKVFGLQALMRQKFAKENKHMRAVNMKQSIASSSTVPITQFFASVSLATVVYIALNQSMQQQSTVGSFVSFITAMLMLLAPMKRLADINGPLQRGLASADSVFALLDEPTEPEQIAAYNKPIQGEITFDHVGFEYPNSQKPALRDICLSVKPGETLALVGPSGGGKSTLATLIPRLIQPSSGKVLVDGEDILSIPMAALRSHIAYVSQDTLLFDDTVAKNIQLGVDRVVTRQELEEAARAANALEFIMQMPEGFETRIGENGTRLSGGQKQRISIARAILKNAPILLLDEATSALDNESEKAVQAALDRLMTSRTTVVIAHRLSTIENATRIAVLSDGAIAEVGTHQELLAKKGVYANLHAMQFTQVTGAHP